jgi:hypothetical protein
MERYLVGSHVVHSGGCVVQYSIPYKADQCAFRIVGLERMLIVGDER